ncbi:MAG: hypothetical protein SFV15_00850 [Polyangiaceae bacterium]|nr:hypothetical protein [Polyangiaceae bacterium]
MKLFLCSLAALLVTACIPEFPEDTALVDSPRVLAIRAEAAEAAPEQSVKLSVLVAAPPGVAIPTPNWAFCSARKPLAELGPVASDCLLPESAGFTTREAIGSGLDAEASLTKDACRQFGPIRPEPKPGQPAGRPVDPDVTGGFYQPVVLELGSEVALGSVRLICGLTGLPREESVKYNAQYRANTNPVIDELKATEGGAPVSIRSAQSGEKELTLHKGSSVELSALFASCPSEPICGDGVCSAIESKEECGEDCNLQRGCSGAEEYTWFNPVTRVVEQRRESVVASWFATGGSFGAQRTGNSGAEGARSALSNRYIAPMQVGPQTLWIVLRDDRGGVGWQTLNILVQD